VKKVASKLTAPKRNHASSPADLKATGRLLWRTILDEYEINDSGSLCLLGEACRALDRADQCAKVIDKEGLVIETKMGFRDHPLMKAELLLRSFATRTLVRIGIVDEPKNPVGRPPMQGRGVDDTYRRNMPRPAATPQLRTNGHED
jgi:hypothetical protein